MKKSLLARLMLLLVSTTMLSGCVIWPWWGEDEGHHRGHYEERHEHREHGEHEGGEHR